MKLKNEKKFRQIPYLLSLEGIPQGYSEIILLLLRNKLN
jgi:hypothetical protein